MSTATGAPEVAMTDDYTTPEDHFGAVTIPEVVEAAAGSSRGIVLVDGHGQDSPLPYRVVAAGARRVATALAERGVQPGDRVALVSSTSARLLLCLFGVWRAGAVPVVLAPPHRLAGLADLVADLRRRLDHADARAVIVADAFGGFIRKRVGSQRSIMTCGELVTARRDAPPVLDPDPDALACLQFTSGTTGASRAVALSHRQFLTNAVVCSQRLMLDGDDSVHVSWAPLYHDLGLMATVACTAARITLVLQAPETFLAAPDSWVDALSRHRATSTVTPNFAYGLAARSMQTRPRPLDLSRLRVCGDGSEPTRAAEVRAFVEAGGRYGLRPEAMTAMYGLAEATLSVTMGSRTERLHWDHVERDALAGGRAVPSAEGAPGTRTLAVCGTAVPGVEIAVTDEHGRPVADRVVGEVCVRGPSVMIGYWRDPEATAAVFRDGWLRTGDLGYRMERGLVICGRLKNMIIVGGANLYPEDYEVVAGQAVGAEVICAAFAVPETERMIIVVEQVAGSDPAEVAKQVMERLQADLRHAPDRVVVVRRNTIRRTSSGKVQRGRCRDGYVDGTLPVLAELVR
ncbi:AMP-binding protein [Dactylosporangium roseum]|uniref:AMP-binding protein n=1 Tax=Dactylosporangium roseum TaxID=47989 RepID=A0ABY5YY88_9ACTN|nr:AMP-binding protein [Dactylosporangium roseum]UWZ34706.1 AMP-binding protein [Dactylosporangium roseum]